ncbi:2-iminoacetate synthase ThiH [Natranaerobius thermophilus]|uniref:Thiazole biosynthesis protein ThiH n=1 Tax=Natranaerobius thermophilus (strain ATCC BAA-1301 / DSM 18059 / JW/NM-WN-LF) TaxID=457570 RepID=B2A6F5_NATTJ|nr:2-iminoacetate synthase ThiH [Natranaerobius thermophilus]ACB85488.1 thiazole biosynthesis protein ThiH [Natranaerobius thermophilus JW/NM-WN-LF]
MSFRDFIKKYQQLDFQQTFQDITPQRVETAIYKDNPNFRDFLAMLSPAAENYLEEMAQKANQLTTNFFGKAIVLYAPIYVSDHCDNNCLYCAFKVDNQFQRTTLSLEEVEQEAQAISHTGLRHILLLTGESKPHAPLDYIEKCIDILKKYFSSIAIEIYPLTAKEYKQLIDNEVDGLTIYQEVYDEDIYQQVHKSGPKRDYDFRLLAPERSLQMGMRRVNIGALFGLGPWRQEAFFTGLHAWYLLNHYPEAEISISFPRLRPFADETLEYYRVADKNLVQMIVATRIFLHSVGINISTRESPDLRENLLPLGVTRMSAGAKTAVGSYSGVENSESQFHTADERSVVEIKGMLINNGYQPVLKDWELI